MHDPAAQWLMQEAVDHLAEDDLGVYELLWLLRGSDFGLDEAAAEALARKTAARLLTAGTAKLVHLKWPTKEIVPGEISEDALYNDNVFEFSEAGVYLALESTESA
ncbi:hypothetical protein ACQPXH_07120 [Nocardia sp. CA-135953]|uniref:hypothetical protein n=1 Tax=Nocardia sp. CA-135953 TaxID=3239978 RepID=UPI003D975663